MVADHVKEVIRCIRVEEDPNDSELTMDQLIDKLAFLCERQRNYECVEYLYNEYLSI